MQNDKLQKLQNLGSMSITAQEIAESRLKFQASTSPCQRCQTIATWIIKKAAGTGSCLAGEAALDGIFALADIVFVEADEILVPLEVVIGAFWGVACGEVGITVLGRDAEKYGKICCQKAKLC